MKINSFFSKYLKIGSNRLISFCGDEIFLLQEQIKKQILKYINLEISIAKRLKILFYQLSEII